MNTETDRELLECAAKAAGLRLVPGDVSGETTLLIQETNRSPAMFQLWNPLTNDGDALRLAVKCQLDVLCNDCGAVAEACIGPQFMEQSTSDPYAATRRAIVRAAAAIGKAMP